MKTLFFSVVYPAVEPFLPDFFQSLEKQTTDDFLIVLVNDGVVELNRFFEGFDPSRISVLEPGQSPVGNRMIGVRHALESNVENLIFGDSDDFFSLNRVKSCVGLLDAGWDVVVNDLTAVDAQGQVLDSGYLSRRLTDGAEVEIDFIRDKNVFGLSNTAVRISALKEISLPEGLVAVDWYIFSQLLLKGCRAVFSDKTNTYYRQHGANTVGVGALDKDSVLCQLDAKVRHYRAMSPCAETYAERCVLYEETWSLLKDRPDFVAEYTEFLKQREKKDPLWWENILPWEK